MAVNDPCGLCRQDATNGSSSLQQSVVAMGRRARSLDGGRRGRQPRSGHPRAATWAAGRLTGRQGQRVDHVVDVVARNARPAKEVEGGTPSDGYGSEVTAPAIY